MILQMFALGEGENLPNHDSVPRLSKAWVNGVLKLDHHGPTLYQDYGVSLKLANYHPAFGQSSSVIHDRVIRGTTWQAVSLTPLEGVQP